MRKMTVVGIGAVGGLAAAALMGSSYKLIAKASHATPSSGEDATEKVANAVVSNVAGHGLRKSQTQAGGQIVHYTFGASMGALYGFLAETLPIATLGAGTLFGTALYIGAHAVTVPALGLAESPLQHRPIQEAPEFGAHLVYGLTLDAMRRLLARWSSSQR